MSVSIKSFIYSMWIINIAIFFTAILIEKRRPEKTLAWLMLFIIFPPLAFLLYIFFGRNWKAKAHTKGLSKEMKKLVSPIIKNFNGSSRALMTMVATTSGCPIFINNEITIFNNGVEKFKALKEELLKAKRHIHLEYYIVKDDGIGREIKDILIKKSLHGVKVKFIIDRVGSIKLSKSYIRDLKNAGVEVAVYSYFLSPILKYVNTQINYRNHRKIAIIDGCTGFVGGINIGDEYINKGKLGYWRDTHMMIKGSAVLGLQSVFLDDFFTIAKVNKSLNIYDINMDDYFPQIEGRGKSTIQIVKSGPTSPYPSIMHAILRLIYSARKYIYIETPYFVPPESIMESLKVAALSGIKVRLLVPSVPDHITVFLASKTYLAELIQCGVEIYAYKDSGFLHSKLLTVDGTIGSLGTANMDIRSYELNYEINTVIYDEEVIRIIEDEFREDIKCSTLMSSDDFKSQNKIQDIIESVARIFSSVL